MPRYAANKMPPEAKRRYFELVRQGLSGSAASSQVCHSAGLGQGGANAACLFPWKRL